MERATGAAAGSTAARTPGAGRRVSTKAAPVLARPGREPAAVAAVAAVASVAAVAAGGKHTAVAEWRGGGAASALATPQLAAETAGTVGERPDAA